MHTLLINNLPYVYAVSEESDDTENLLSEIQELKEELRKAQEKLKNVDRRVYPDVNISSKRKRGGDDDGNDDAGPSTSRQKDDGNQSDKVRLKQSYKDALTITLTRVLTMN